jgi:DNA repair exonuclease SbcCD ATPase subunit
MFAAFKLHPRAAQEDQLLKLYWNRAGVKRELADLKRERFELLDRIKEQEGEIYRAKEQLEGLERLLVDPKAAANAMVYFQLRHLWRVASTKIAQFGNDFAAQREQRERGQLHAEVIAKRNRRLSAIQQKLSDLLHKRKDIIESRVAHEARLEHAGFLVRLFVAPGLHRQIRVSRENKRVLDERINELNELVEKIQGEPLPDPEGLGLESRRLVNIAIIALAQHLVAHFADHDLARLAKAATERPVADRKFGDRSSCDKMVELIRDRVEDLDRDRRLADAVRQRTDFLSGQVEYRHDTDTVPRVESVAQVRRAIEPMALNGNAARQASDGAIGINVLLDEYWDIYQNLR